MGSKRDRVVTIRLTPAELAQVRALASRMGLSMSEYTRQAAKPRNPTIPTVIGPFSWQTNLTSTAGAPVTWNKVA